MRAGGAGTAWHRGIRRGRRHYARPPPHVPPSSSRSSASMAPKQLFDAYRIPLATETLALVLEFDVSSVADWQDMPNRDHAAAAHAACTATGLRPPNAVVARSRTTEGAAGLKEAHSLPYYSDGWLTDPAAQIRLEFLYAASSPQLSIRILNNLSHSDGVTAVSSRSPRARARSRSP